MGELDRDPFGVMPSSEPPWRRPANPPSSAPASAPTTQRVWCVSCSYDLTADGLAPVSDCPNCHKPVPWDESVRVARAWYRVHAARAGVRKTERAAQQAERSYLEARVALNAARGDATAARAECAELEATWGVERTKAHNAQVALSRTRVAAKPTVPTSAAPATSAWASPATHTGGAVRQPGTTPPRPVAATPQSVTPAPKPTPHPRRQIPLAVLLQGTGAVLLLAALVIASAVLWETLAEGLQVVILVAAVMIVGGLSVVARPLPATSIILAALTMASGLVVASSIPVLLPQLDASWYPAAASAVGTAAMLLAGRAGGIALWRHGGVAGLGLTGLLAVAGVLGETSLDAGSTAWWGLGSLMGVLVALPLLWVCVSMTRWEPEAEATSWWTAMVAAGIVALLALAGVVRWLEGLSQGSTNGRWMLGAGLLATAALSYVAGIAAQRTGRPIAPVAYGAALAFAAPIPVVVLTGAQVDTAAAALVAVIPVALGLMGLVAAGWWTRDEPMRLVPIGVAAVTLVLTAVLAQSSLLDADLDQPYAWLTWTLLGLSVGAAAWMYGTLLDRGPWTASGLALLSATWAMTWSAGHLGDPVEVLTLPVLALLLVTWVLGRMLDLWSLRSWPMIVPQYLILVAILPSLAVSLTAVSEGTLDAARVMLLVAAAASVAILAAWQHTGATLPAASPAVAALAHVWVLVATQASDPPVEWYSLPLAAAIALIAAAGVLDGWTDPRRSAVLVLLTMAVPSAVDLAFAPWWDSETAVRLGLVVGASAAAAWLAWRWPVVAWLSASVGLASAYWVYLVWISDQEWVFPEVIWIPLGAALAGSAALLARQVAGVSSAVAAAAVGVGFAVVPSTLVLFLDPVWGLGTGLRLAYVVAAWSVATVAAWRVPWLAWATGSAALATPVWVYVEWVSQSWAQPVEVRVAYELATIPIAAALGLSAVLLARAVDLPSGPAPQEVGDGGAGVRDGWPRWLGVGLTTGVVCAAVPTLVLVAADPLVEYWETAVRLLVAATGAALITVLVSRVAPIRSAVAATVLVGLPLWVYLQWVDTVWPVPLEAVTVPMALAAAFAAGSYLRLSTLQSWWSRVLFPTGGVVLVVSTAWTLADQSVSTDVESWTRLIVVVAVWAGAAVLSWARPLRAASMGSVAIILMWLQALILAGEQPDPLLEAYTWPAALALLLAVPLIARAFPGSPSSWLVAAPGLSIAFLPTAAVAWQDGTAGWRVWVALLAGGVLVAMGSWREWAGLVYPGLVTLGLVTVPVLVHYAQDLPGWVPLSLVGAALLIIGARMEAVRRRGGQLRHWAAHLH